MLKIEYSLTLNGKPATGWAEGKIQDSEKEFSFKASYLSDVLGDLLTAVGNLADGQLEAIATFEDEPGEYRWWFLVQQAGDVMITIATLDVRDQESDEETVEFVTTTSLAELVSAIYTAADTVLKAYGEAGYKKQWVAHDFPREPLAKLKEHIRVTSSD